MSVSDARAKAARYFFAKAGLTVEPVDDHQWRVSTGLGELLHGEASSPRPVFLFWPATGFWRRPDGTAGGGGPRALIKAIRGS